MLCFPLPILSDSWGWSFSLGVRSRLMLACPYLGMLSPLTLRWMWGLLLVRWTLFSSPHFPTCLSAGGGVGALEPSSSFISAYPSLALLPPGFFLVVGWSWSGIAALLALSLSFLTIVG